MGVVRRVSAQEASSSVRKPWRRSPLVRAFPKMATLHVPRVLMLRRRSLSHSSQPCGQHVHGDLARGHIRHGQARTRPGARTCLTGFLVMVMAPVSTQYHHQDPEGFVSRIKAGLTGRDFKKNIGEMLLDQKYFNGTQSARCAHPSPSIAIHEGYFPQKESETI